MIRPKERTDTSPVKKPEQHPIKSERNVKPAVPKTPRKVVKRTSKKVKDED